MSDQLSVAAKQTFQVTALLATVLVVGIHYKSDVPDHADPALATYNQLAQEFLLGGIARVAVPLFAFAAGLFYFLSDDATFTTYQKKLKQRFATVALPYLIIASVAMLFWGSVRLLEGKPLEKSTGELVATWLLHPPAEQLWFLRDLMVLVAIAPLIGWLCRARFSRILLVGVLSAAWISNSQFSPIVMAWHILHIETLLFFTLGCLAASRSECIERVGNVSTSELSVAVGTWLALVAARVGFRADFDIWYNMRYGSVDLVLHQASILVGCVCLFAIAWRMRFAILLQLSGASFFVYLVHEFPLRAVIERVVEKAGLHGMQQDASCWIVIPLVVAGCYAAAVALSRLCPSGFAIITGGRAPSVMLPRLVTRRVRESSSLI